jgi:recombination protein RecA
MTINAEAQAVIAKLNKKLGGDVVVVGSDINVDMQPRITTGSVTWDYVLGGGMPSNQWNELIGESSHGKTGVVMKMLAANQEKDPNFTCVWVAAEAWVPQYAEMCGVDQSRVIIIETQVMEEAYDAVIAFAESKAVDMIVIDSLPALTPSPEVDKTMEELTVGRGALLTNKFFRKVGSAMKRSMTEQERPVCGIVINQWRMKIGVMHGDPRTTPGGVGKDYAYFTRNEVKRDDWIEIGPSGNKKRVGQTIRIRTLKNKTAPPQRVAYVDYVFDDGYHVPPGSYDTAKEIVSLAVLKEIITRKGAWYYFGEEKWNGMADLLAAVREDIDLAEKLTVEVLSSPDGPSPVTEP